VEGEELFAGVQLNERTCCGYEHLDMWGSYMNLKAGSWEMMRE
jgi:hypothetical protein